MNNRYVIVNHTTGEVTRCAPAQTAAVWMLGRDVFRYSIIKVGVGLILLRSCEYNAVLKQLEDAV